jgi:outer membrane protein insertion porin family
MRKAIFVLLTTFLLGSSYSLVLAEEVSTKTTEVNSSDQLEQKTTVASETAPVVLKNVTAIEVTGNRSISTNVIISKMKTHIGSAYQENIISDDLKRLYLLGFFSDIKTDTQDYKDGLKVVINVVERPIIDKINFSGINAITMKDEKLKQQLKSKETQYLDYPNLAEDVQILKKMYEKIGYSQAEITYKVEEKAPVNKVDIVFTAVEGKKVRVKNIILEGNKSISSGRILKLLKTKRAWFFNAGVLKEDVLKEDIERVKSLYQREGFTDVVVTDEINPHPKKPYLLFVVIKIVEGKKYLVGSVIVQGNKDVTEKQILKSLADCIPGKVFSQEGVKKDVASIQGLYFDRGYISAQVQDSTLVNTDSGRVDITYDIAENQVIYVDKIKMRGNIKTKDLVIRRELRIHPGDKFDGDKLRRSKERLANLGFFEEINYDTEETSQPDKKNLVVEVKETKTGAFSFGGGYSTVDQLVGFVEIEQKNFDWRNWPYFTGAGQDLKVRASIGSVSNGAELNFTEPWMFDYPVSFGFDLYRREHKQDTDVGYGYDETVTGGDLRLGTAISEYWRADLMYRLDQVHISNIDPATTSSALLDEAGTNFISSITPSLTYDSRDNVFFPRRGNYFTTSLEFAGGPLSGDKNFWKFFSQFSHYIPMPHNAAIEFKGRVGVADPFGSSATIPIYERFFAGGAYTLRGYDERKVGPVDPSTGDPLGGASMLIGNIEYTYPLFQFLKVAAFYDVGNVWDKLSDICSTSDTSGINSGGFKSDIGLGLRINTPIGPIMLDYGIPLNKQSGETSRKSGRFNFSASHGF